MGVRSFEIMESAGGVRRAVKQGWSWPGFFFSWIWAFRRGLWLEGLAGLGLSLLAGAFAVPGFTFGLWWFDLSFRHGPPGAGAEGVATGVWFAVAVAFALGGNRARAYWLRRQGFRSYGVMPARNEAEALGRVAMHRETAQQYG